VGGGVYVLVGKHASECSPNLNDASNIIYMITRMRNVYGYLDNGAYHCVLVFRYLAGNSHLTHSYYNECCSNMWFGCHIDL